MLLTQNKAALGILPRLPGVFALSKVEIKKDLREMLRDVTYDDDTDGSVKSDDILSSTYPVKPRKAPRRDRALHIEQLTSGEQYDLSAVSSHTDTDENLRFVQMMEATKPELFAAELSREEKDILYQSLHDSLTRGRKSFASDKKMQENYFRVLQAMHTRALQLRTGYVLRNEVLLDSYTVLQQREDATDAIRSNAPAGQTNVLRVTLAPSQRKMVLYKGQILLTPYGKGKVLRIFTTTTKLDIQLAYGVMSATVATAISWSISQPGGADTLTDEYLLHHWTAFEGKYNAPVDYNARLRQMLSRLDGEDGDTDGADSLDADGEEPAGEVDQQGDEAETSAAQQKFLISRPIGSVSSKALTYVFATPAALPYIVDNIEVKTAPHSVFARDADEFALSLLNDEKELEDLQSLLAETMQHLKEAQENQKALIFDVERLRARSAELLRQASALRLSMFTKRVCLRNMQQQPPPSLANADQRPGSSTSSEAPRQESRPSKIDKAASKTTTAEPADPADEGKAKKRGRGDAKSAAKGKGEESPSIEEEGVTTEGNDKKKAKRGSGGAGKR